MFIYLDESGDLRFDFPKEKTTRKFVITIIVCNSNDGRKEFRKEVRRILKNKLNRKKKNTRYVAELKGRDTTLEIKEYFLRNIKSYDWEIYPLALNKIRIERHFRTKIGKKKLYNYLSKILLEKLPFA